MLVDRECRGDALDMLLDPLLLFGILDVHVLDAEGPAVGVAQDVQDLVERGGVLAGEPVAHEVTGKVPDGQPVVERVQLRMESGRLRVEGVEVGDEVPPDPVHVDEGLDVHLLGHPQVVATLAVGSVEVPLPSDRFVGDLEGLEHLVVEVVPSHQAFRHEGEEQTRLGSLDDPVVVGRSEGHRLPDTEVGEGVRIRSLEARGESEGPHPDDESLAGHQAGHRLDRSERPRVGEGDRGAAEVVRADLVGVDLPHQLLVAC